MRFRVLSLSAPKGFKGCKVGDGSVGFIIKCPKRGLYINGKENGNYYILITPFNRGRFYHKMLA